MQHTSKTRILFLFALLFLIAPKKSSAQFYMYNLKYAQGLSEGTLYIVMPNPTSPKEKAFVDMYNKYWTMSKVQFIKPSEQKKYLVQGNYFLEIVIMKAGSLNHTDKDIYLQLYQCISKSGEDKILVMVPLFQVATDVPDNSPTLIYETNTNQRNWGVGIFRNYILQIQSLLKEEKETLPTKTVANDAELAKLKSSTLFVPDYVLIDYNYDKASADEKKKITEKIFQNYPSEYEIITTNELNNKILNENEPFYYLVLVTGHADNTVSIVNSSTGEVIFNDTYSAYNKLDNHHLKSLISKLKSI